MPTYSVDSNIRKKGYKISYDVAKVQYSEPVSSVPTLTNSSTRETASMISKKPMLIAKAELQNTDINLVGINPLQGLITNSNKTFSNKLLNYVEPYDINGTIKTLFYTSVNTELKVGDRVFIINGNYDNDLLIKENKYKKGRDGYKILYIDRCKVVLDIDYTGVLPYTEKVDDDFIKIFYIKNKSEFLWANRAITTRDDVFKNKFSYYQNNIAFIDSDYPLNTYWGANGGVSGTPGFYVRDDSRNWVSITDDLMSGSYSIVASTYSIDRIKIMNEDFTTDDGKEFKSGYIYKWTAGVTQSSWEIDVEYFEPYLTKNNFRDGIFKGVWNSGLYGQYSTRINWHGDGSTWNNGALINTIWQKGQINSLYTTTNSYFANLDSSGTPYQKVNSPNNAGRGYNFISDSIMYESDVKNGSFYKTTFGSASATFSIVENEILNIESPYINTINKSFFNKCIFNNSYLIGSELKNTLANNSKFEKVKSINSYFNNSVFKNSLYNSDNIIKVWAYDELSASETVNLPSTYSQTNSVDQKVYKFYIDKDGYNRLKVGDTFYIKGIKINNGSKEVITIFDRKFKIGTWGEWTEEKITQKTGYEYAAFLSTPIENSYKFYSINDVGYYTIASQSNSNSNLYSIDIWVSRYYDVLGSPSGNDNIDFNHDSVNNIPLANIIDISSAYIVDSDFNSGLFEESDWNSGSHIESNNDTNITVNTTAGGEYNLSIDSNYHLIATTSYNSTKAESGLINLGDVVFLNCVDFFDGTTASRISDTYKVIGVNSNEYTLQEIGSYSLISLSASVGTFSTIGAQNRYGHIKKLKINKANIKSGFLGRSYITNSLIQNLDYDYTDKDYNNLQKIKNLVVSDSIFSKTNNILSNATYLNSFFVDNSDIWNSGIIQNSIWNGGTFSNGVIRDSRWVNGHFLNGVFYNSKTFNGIASTTSPYYYSENINSYYRMGNIPNNRNSWQDGIFENGEFYKSDWEFGTFSNGRFYHSKWYDGVFNNGVIGSKTVTSTDTMFYNGTVSYAIVENASLYASDTSSASNVDQNIYWTNGIFQDGLFGSNYGQTASNSATWYGGQFNGGQFISNGKWKNGTFNGGMFLSGYGYTESDITLQSDFAWENGTFNGGEFGNANGLTNSTWYTGDFNGGIFKGRLWNNGVFTYGEFQGSGVAPIGGTNCGSASAFVDSFTLSYWGKWNGGIFTDTKDKFIKDQKMFTTPVKAEIIEKSLQVKKTAKFKNGLWISGTFSHPNGEMIGSIWLDGAFERGKFSSSSFNPYVKRNGSTASSFNLDDTTCYWENGDFYHSDFYISRWKSGNFLIGTATGMIWEDGVANYMNAYNVFWEDGTWRNGNWHGSSFEYDGTVHDDYALSILRRGMSWSGTTSCHLWNIFQDYIGQEANIADVDAATVSSTGWVASNSSSIIINIPIEIPDEER